MLCSRLGITLLLAATCSLLDSGSSAGHGHNECANCEHSVTCERTLANLQCDDEEVLFISSAVYGRGDNTTCSSGRSASELGNVNCSSEVTDKVAERCNGKSSCIVGGFNLMFGDPCVGTYKYLDVSYTCQSRCVTCERTLAELKCDDGQQLIIHGATYGRGDNTTCSSGRSASELGNVNCSSEVTDKVAERCNGKSSCIIEGFNLMFGDPCVGTYKYLDVSYTCISRSTTCERTLANLRCDDDMVLSVYDAFYGRRDNTTCALGRSSAELADVNCSSQVTDIVAQRCNGKNSCLILGFNSKFGDPCAGIYKYLDVLFFCKELAK
ncbi:L-rhamnose-binding lectin CSL3 [Scophthalmus maximus]|uniref:L-rhamnose-binding lectin CSL3 n=1 Tax=Scophthalmus maximus TaxID=52904 RepID=UPI0015E0C64A|nr:L-rhamnose-binding lectin CSL3 [Scophthalmus maximus]